MNSQRGEKKVPGSRIQHLVQLRLDLKLLTIKHCGTLKHLHTFLITCVTHVYMEADDLHCTVHT